jgi:hypothetical protein
MVTEGNVANRAGSGYTLFVSQIQIDQLIAMQPVNCQDDQDHEIRDEHEHVKAVQDVVLARLVEELFVRGPME